MRQPTREWPDISIVPEPQFQEIGTGRTLRLVHAVTIRDGVRRHWWTIPAGFVFDGPSVPRWCALLVDRTDIGDVAALVHDACYAQGGRCPAHTPRPYTRAQADQLLVDVMRRRGASRVRRWLTWAGVRLGGARRWQTPSPEAAAVNRVLAS